MRAKLYQVCNADDNGLIMIAPLAVIRQVFGLHSDAVKRIEQETSASFNGVCRFCFNNRPVPTNNNWVLITESKLVQA